MTKLEVIWLEIVTPVSQQKKKKKKAKEKEDSTHISHLISSNVNIKCAHKVNILNYHVVLFERNLSFFGFFRKNFVLCVFLFLIIQLLH